MIDIDLTALGDRELIGLMNELLAWHEYAGVIFAKSETEFMEAEAAMSQAEAISLIQNWGGTKEDRVTISKAQRDTDPAVMALQRDLTYAYARRKMLANLYDSLERKVAVVSRELTRRTSIEPAQRRKHRHGGA